jgi:hypothetical protein
VEQELDGLEEIHRAYEAGTQFRLRNLYPKADWEAKSKRERSELGVAFRARVRNGRYRHLEFVEIDGRNQSLYRRV